MRRKLGGALAGALLGILVLGSGDARAQSQQAAAQALFDQARKLMADGKYAEACPKFADSQKLDPAPGTLLNLAKCYEKNGQSASAWVSYKEAESVSKRTGHPDWAGIAHDRVVAIEPTLSKLTITVPPTSEVDGLQLTNDGNPVARSEWNSAIPVDPGQHAIEATAPNTRKWSTTVHVDPNGAKATVTIPQLEVERTQTPGPSTKPEATPASDRGPGQPQPSGLGTQRILGIAVGAAGVVGVGVGTVFGLIAKSKNDQALQNCRTTNFCNPQGLSLTSDAKSAATISTIGFAAGGALLVAGVVLFVTAPKSAPSTTTARLQVAPWIDPRSGGVAMGGAW